MVQPVRDADRSDRAGYPIYKDVTYVMVIAQGDKDAISVPASPEMKRQYRQDWEAFQAAVARSASPLRVLPGISVSIVAAFNELGIRTVEALCAAPIAAARPSTPVAIDPDADELPDEPTADAYVPEPLAKWRDIGMKYLAFRAEVLGQPKPRWRMSENHLEYAA